jgi:hypothetical protein
VTQPNHSAIAARLERLANNQFEPNELRRQQMLSGAEYQRALAAAEAAQAQRDAARARSEPRLTADGHRRAGRTRVQELQGTA